MDDTSFGAEFPSIHPLDSGKQDPTVNSSEKSNIYFEEEGEEFMTYTEPTTRGPSRCFGELSGFNIFKGQLILFSTLVPTYLLC